MAGPGLLHKLIRLPFASPAKQTRQLDDRATKVSHENMIQQRRINKACISKERIWNLASYYCFGHISVPGRALYAEICSTVLWRCRAS